MNGCKVINAKRIMLMLAAWAVISPISAQTYPSKPIRLVVPFPPGAGSDLITRVVATRFSETPGQRLVVENKPGATGAIGLDFVAKSPPDGYTVGLLIVSHAVFEALDDAKTPYDLVRDFTPVVQLNSIPYLLVVNPRVPAKSVKELVALARAKPGTLTYGSSGTGGVIHLAGAWLASASNTRMVHVPYKGNAQAMPDLVGGHIDFLFTSIATAGSFMKQQKLRGLAVTSSKRLDQVPDLPTMQEAGIANYVVEGWYGIAGPAGMASPIVNKLNSEIGKAVNHADTRAKLALDGAAPAAGTPKEFAAHISGEMEKWSRIVKEAAIKVD
jgi:tripartite-type tricarboxylate transporter receptor subunit TctC